MNTLPMRELKNAVIAVVACTVVLGLAYPLVMTGVAQLAFGDKADGSVVEREGKAVGSRLIGQDFSRETGETDDVGEPVLEADPRYFQSRPSVTGYAPNATFFNNLGPNQKDLSDLLKENMQAYLDRERPSTPGLTAAKVPPDAVTTSASGVDPHISEANALIQANRVAQERGVDRARVLELLDDHATRPILGLAGEKSINVLELNLALDAEAR
ncbi:MAG: potassium-transporting ATPase subunit C [Solirubrobacteraceae bacterium]